MNFTKFVPRLILSLLMVFFTLRAMAEGSPLAVSHRLLSSGQSTDGHTPLTLELNVTNDGIDSLSGVTLYLMPGTTLLVDTQEPLTLGDVAAGQTVSTQWHITVLGEIEGNWPFFQQLNFGAEANDNTGEFLTFPVESKELQP
jgi:hypothetical protein